MKKSLLILVLISSVLNAEELIGVKILPQQQVVPLTTAPTQQHNLVKPKVDILILWDNTSSFNFTTTASKNSLNKLITNLSENFDYHVLSVPLVATSGQLGDAKLLSSNPASVSGTATSILKLNKDQTIASLEFSKAPGGSEMGIDRATSLLEGNHTNGIFRKGAYTLIVMMSNEDDKGCELATGYDNCSQADLATYRQAKINHLLCLRGNVSGINCSGISALNSKMMRFITIAPLSACASGLNKINYNYRETSKQLYEKPYSSGSPTSSDHLVPDLLGYPDSYNLCSIDFSHTFDGVYDAIMQTSIKQGEVDLGNNSRNVDDTARSRQKKLDEQNLVVPALPSQTVQK